MEYADAATIPIIHSQIQECWQNLHDKYQSTKKDTNTAWNRTLTLFYMGHTQRRSARVHSIASHLDEAKTAYTQKNNYGYRLLETGLLEGINGLRDSLVGLASLVYDLDVDLDKQDASDKVLQKSKNEKLPISDYLEQLVPDQSALGKYLDEFDHLLTEREPMRNMSVSELTSNISESEQPRIMHFIEKSKAVTEWLKDIEKAIAKECLSHLGLG